MRTNRFFIAIVILLFITSCQNDTVSEDKLKEQENQEIIAVTDDVDTTLNVTQDSNTVDTVGNIENEKVETPTKNTSKKKNINISSNKIKKEEKKHPDESNKATEENIKTAEDLSGELNNKVNRKVNPDNYNGVSEPESESDVNLVPVFTEDQLDNYFVQVLVKVHKLSKSEIVSYFKNKEKVYVVQNEGLYKYCLGNFETEGEAQAYKKEVDKKYNFKNIQVVTFKQAW